MRQGHEVKAHHGRVEVAQLAHHLPFFLVYLFSSCRCKGPGNYVFSPCSLVGHRGAQREEMSRAQIRMRQRGRMLTPIKGPVEGPASGGEMNGISRVIRILSSFEAQIP